MKGLTDFVNQEAGKLFEQTRMSLTEATENTCVFSNGYCYLRFVKEYLDVYVDVSANEYFSPKYALGFMVYSVLGEKINMYADADSGVREKLQMQEYVAYLSNQFRGVFDGDFSWESKYQVTNQNEIELRKKMHTIPRDNPIWKKYLSDDMSWKEDIKKLGGVTIN